MVSVCIWLCYSNTDGLCEPAFERGNIAIGRFDQDVLGTTAFTAKMS